MKMYKEGTRTFKASNSTFTDTAPGVVKDLTIKFEYGGKSDKKTVKENSGNDIVLPGDHILPDDPANSNDQIKLVSIIEKFTSSASSSEQSRTLLLKMNILPKLSILLDYFLVCNQIRIKCLIVKIFQNLIKIDLPLDIMDDCCKQLKMSLAKELDSKIFNSSFLNLMFAYQKRIRNTIGSRIKMNREMLEVDHAIQLLFREILKTESEFQKDIRKQIESNQDIELLRILPNSDTKRMIRGIISSEGVVCSMEDGNVKLLGNKNANAFELDIVH